MSVIVWDAVEDRTFETGIDRGVLYPVGAPAVPWNGLTEIVERSDMEVRAIYYDGMKINDRVEPGDFEATIKAVTYPEDFTAFEGMVEAIEGMYLGHQKPESFGLCYRNFIGNAEGNVDGYKIHIVYNVTAKPSERGYGTLQETPNLVEFEWEISAVPEEVTGYRPTAHIIINSNKLDPELLQLLEEILYGTDTSDPELIPMAELIVLLLSWLGVVIVDNGDGTWTAYSSRPPGDNPITPPVDGVFSIDDVTGVFLDADTYQISSSA